VSEGDELLKEFDRSTAGQGPAGTPTKSAEVVPLKRGINYSHTAMIDLIIQHPGISQNEIARFFGYTAAWISTIMGTDAFQTALAARREQIVDPTLRATLEEQARGLWLRSMEVLREKMNCDAANIPDQLALQTFAQSARALGYGARPPPSTEPVNLSEKLIDHADNLVRLLRRERKRAEEIIDVPSTVSEVSR